MAIRQMFHSETFARYSRRIFSDPLRPRVMSPPIRPGTGSDFSVPIRPHVVQKWPQVDFKSMTCT